MKNVAFALIALMIAPSLAIAGGGGSNSKDDPTLKVINRTDFTVLVVIDEDDFDSELMQEALESNDPHEQLELFTEAHGKVLEDEGDFVKFDVQAGRQTIYYFILDGDLPTGAFDFEPLRTFVSAGQDKKVYIRTNVFPAVN